ncbi:hypothetical protein JXB02_02390 [Candidatus Woesearchaeota archaeon]|nr:hypothetical protein [Candidatus Woesearchaeota archaeon]
MYMRRTFPLEPNPGTGARTIEESIRAIEHPDDADGMMPCLEEGAPTGRLAA